MYVLHKSVGEWDVWGLRLLAPAALLRALGGGARDVGWGMLADRHTHKEAVVTPEFLCHLRLLNPLRNCRNAECHRLQPFARGAGLVKQLVEGFKADSVAVLTTPSAAPRAVANFAGSVRADVFTSNAACLRAAPSSCQASPAL